MRGIVRFISSVGFVGKSPIAPGTAGSFLAYIAWYFIQPEMTIVMFLLAIFAIFFIGLYTSQLTENILLSNQGSYNYSLKSNSLSTLTFEFISSQNTINLEAFVAIISNAGNSLNQIIMISESKTPLLHDV